MTDATKFQIRMPVELHQQLADSAKKNNRSLNTEVVMRLQSTYGEDDLTLRVGQLERQVAELRKRKG